MSLQYLRSNGDSGNQLYFDGGLFNFLRETKAGVKTWRCIDYNKLCNCVMQTHEDKVFKESTVPHFGHEYITQEDYMCRLALVTMKQRVSEEINVFPSTIYNEERVKLQDKIDAKYDRMPSPAVLSLRQHIRQDSRKDKAKVVRLLHVHRRRQAQVHQDARRQAVPAL